MIMQSIVWNEHSTQHQTHSVYAPCCYCVLCIPQPHLTADFSRPMSGDRADKAKNTEPKHT